MLKEFRKSRSLRFIFLIVFLSMTLGLALFHAYFHAGDEHASDCSVCRLVQQIACAFFLALILLIEEDRRSHHDGVAPFSNFMSACFLSAFQNRAPPRLS